MENKLTKFSKNHLLKKVRLFKYELLDKLIFLFLFGNDKFKNFLNYSKFPWNISLKHYQSSCNFETVNSIRRSTVSYVFELPLNSHSLWIIEWPVALRATLSWTRCRSYRYTHTHTPYTVSRTLHYLWHYYK